VAIRNSQFAIHKIYTEAIYGFCRIAYRVSRIAVGIR